MSLKILQNKIRAMKDQRFINRVNQSGHGVDKRPPRFSK